MRFNFDGHPGITDPSLPDRIKLSLVYRMLNECMAIVVGDSVQVADHRPVWDLLEAMRRPGFWQRHAWRPQLAQFQQYFEGSSLGNQQRRQLRAYNELPTPFIQPVHVLSQVEPNVWAYLTYFAPVLLPNAAEAHPSQVALQAHTLEGLDDLYGAKFQAWQFNGWYEEPSTYAINYRLWRVNNAFVPTKNVSPNKFKITVPLAVAHVAVIKSAVTLRVMKEMQSELGLLNSDQGDCDRIARERDMINQLLRDDQSDFHNRVMAMLPEGAQIYQDDEDQTEPEEEDEGSTCPGCADNQPNQAAHMVPGGCLDEDDEPPTADDEPPTAENKPPNLKAIEHEQKAREAWRVAREEARARHRQTTQRHRLEEARMRGPCPQAEIVQLREENERLRELVQDTAQNFSTSSAAYQRELDKRDAEIERLRKQLKGYDADVRHECNETLSKIIGQIEFDENPPRTAPSSPRTAPQAPNSLHGGGIGDVSPAYARRPAREFSASKRQRLGPVLMRIPSPEY